MAETKKNIMEAMREKSQPAEAGQGQEQNLNAEMQESQPPAEASQEQKSAPSEEEFWKKLIENKLKPIPPQLASGTDGLKKSLRSLRNASLVALFLVNIMWIIVLYLVRFPRLALYGLDPRAFQLLFLAVYGFIIIIQFVAMICHRGISLVHYFGRSKMNEAEEGQKELGVGGQGSINNGDEVTV